MRVSKIRNKQVPVTIKDSPFMRLVNNWIVKTGTMGTGLLKIFDVKGILQLCAVDASGLQRFRVKIQFIKICNFLKRAREPHPLDQLTTAVGKKIT